MIRSLHLLILSALASVLSLSSCSSSRNVTSVTSATLDTLIATPRKILYEYKLAPKRSLDIVHTKLNLKPIWKNQTLEGKATLSVKPYFYDIDSAFIDAKGFRIDSIALIWMDSVFHPAYSYDSFKIRMDLGRTFTSDQHFTLYIEYLAQPEILGQLDPPISHGDKGLYFINADGKDKYKPKQIWTQGETHSSSCWFPTVDEPNEKTTQELYITVDTQYVSLSNGDFIYSSLNGDGTRTDFWNMKQPHAPYLFMIAVGDFDIYRESWRDMPVYYYLEQKYKAFSKDIFGNTPEMLEFYSNLFGVDYPFDKYAQVVVRDFVSGAMENTTATVHGSLLNQTKREMIDGHHEDYTAHELAHQWFGDLVTCESWANLPLNESFATYAEYLWFEYKYGKDFAHYHMYKDKQRYLRDVKRNGNKKLIRYHYKNEGEMFDGHSYQKGGLVLHMLRNQLGDKAFFTGIKKYLEDNKFQTAEISDLRKAFESVCGLDLKPFFDQWFMQAGHPKVEVKYAVDSLNKLSIFFYQSQVDEEGYYNFEIPLKIQLKDGKGVQLFNTNISNVRDTVFIQLEGNLDYVTLDPDNSILWELEEEKAEAWYQNDMKGNFFKRLTAISYFASMQNVSPIAQQELFTAMKDSFYFIRKQAIHNYKPASESDSIRFSNQLRSFLKDSHSHVRDEAIKKLIKLDGKEAIASIEPLLLDSSYRVMATAMREISKYDIKLALSYAERFRQEENNSIYRILSNVYSRSTPNTGDQLDYMFELMEKGSSYTKFQVLNDIGTTVIGIGNADKKREGIELLLNYALTDKSYRKRYQSYRALHRVSQSLDEAIFNDSTNVEYANLSAYLKTSFNEIAKEEKNSKIKEFLDSVSESMNN